jgi:fermentation-respiration switch protein FrsA (DUF1100 family)
MSTQTFGADPAGELSPRCSLLLAHGTSDEILPHRCSEHAYAMAGQPKKLLLKDGARHGLDEWADELPHVLRWWIRTELTRDPGDGSAADLPMPDWADPGPAAAGTSNDIKEPGTR